MIGLACVGGGDVSQAGATPATAEAAPSVARVQVPPGTDDVTVMLVTAYAPILRIGDQRHPCDTEGDPFNPSMVDPFFGNDRVVLREGRSNPPLLQGPVATDLYGQSADVHLDLPGNPRNPGCTYEQLYRETVGDRPAVTYAHVVIDPQRQELAGQYWFYYPFNRWNNTHESDWEMIMVIFPGATPAEALAQGPDRLAYAQHATGELAGWDDDNVEVVGTHPVVYASIGSHASYFQEGVYLGFGEHGSGFGCDHASGQFQAVPLEPVLLPTGPIEASSPFAWITFEGHWGERQPGYWNGPTGPNQKRQWEDPFGWAEELRGSSVLVARRNLPGPDAVSNFCTLVAMGASFFNLTDQYPCLVYPLAAGVVGGVAVLLWLQRPVLARTLLTYARAFGVFLVYGVWTMVIGVGTGVAVWALGHLPVFRDPFRLLGDAALAGWAAATVAGTTHLVPILLLVAPGVVLTVTRTRWRHRGRPWVVDLVAPPRAMVLNLVRSVLPRLLVLVLLALTVVGLPWAIMLAVRWALAPYAVVVDAVPPQDAATVSGDLVRGHWWRVAVSIVTLVLVGVAIAPLIGPILMVTTDVPLLVINLATSVLYGATLPFTLVAGTHLYLELRKIVPELPPSRQARAHNR